MSETTVETPETPEPTEPEPATPNAAEGKSTEQEEPTGSNGTEPEPVLREKESQEWQQQAQVINNFLAPVDAGHASFGHTSMGSSYRVSGTLLVEQIDADLRYLVRTDTMAKAEEILRAHHLLVLNGGPGSGKRTCALAVLRAVTVPSTSIRSLPPTDGFPELAASELYREGRGVLVLDQLGDGGDHAVQTFELDRLCAKLRRTKAYLVVTTTRAGLQKYAEDVVIDYSPPDAMAVFDARLPETGVELSEPELERIREHVRTLWHPRDVVRLVDRLPEGVDAALSALGETGRKKVAEWFDSEPKPLEVLTLTALAFQHGLPEQEFQRSLARLVTLYRENSLEVGGPTSVLAGDGPLTQHRSGQSSEHSLDRIVRDRSKSGGSRRREFASAHYRDRVIAEISDRYGFELSIPLQAWLDETAATPSRDARLQLAVGVALLARHSPDEVDSYLDKWSTGLAAERLTASAVLSMMAVDDELAPMAWRTALSWADGVGARRAAVAAMALGGPLGIRYLWEALNELWSLALRSEDVSMFARTAIALLLYSTEVNPDSGTTVLRFLRTALDALLDSEEPGRWHHRQVRKAFRVVLMVLTIKPDRSSELMTTVVLRLLPAETSRVGSLWADVLRSAPHRGEAILGLCLILETLSADETHVDAVSRLGSAIGYHLSIEENRLLYRDLAGTLADSERAELAQPLVSALLAALRKTTTEDSRGEL
jgi:hypothetical protein